MKVKEECRAMPLAIRIWLQTWHMGGSLCDSWNQNLPWIWRCIMLVSLSFQRDISCKLWSHFHPLRFRASLISKWVHVSETWTSKKQQKTRPPGSNYLTYMKYQQWVLTLQRVNNYGIFSLKIWGNFNLQHNHVWKITTLKPRTRMLDRS